MLAVLGLIAALGLPDVLRATRARRVRLAAGELVGVLRSARSYAIRHNARVGVKFWVPGEGRPSFQLHRDGDGDGVRTADIRRGVDPPIGPPRTLVHLGGQVRLGFPPGPPPRDPGDPGRRLDRLDDPVRFNRSDIASFDPLGGSTPGSLYLTDGIYHLSVVRLFGRTGKVRVLTYEPETEVWR